MNEQSKEQPKRWMQAPSPTGAAPPIGVLTGVWLSEGEDVRWSWTHAGGNSYVSGYSIVDKKAPE